MLPTAFIFLKKTIYLNYLQQVISVRDVLQDAYHNFMPSYQARDFVVVKFFFRDYISSFLFLSFFDSFPPLRLYFMLAALIFLCFRNMFLLVQQMIKEHEEWVKILATSEWKWFFFFIWKKYFWRYSYWACNFFFFFFFNLIQYQFASLYDFYEDKSCYFSMLVLVLLRISKLL